jgi:hypothetical protein
MRTPGGVANQIMEIVPNEHKEKFKWLLRDFNYKAIEQTGECWRKLSYLCNSLLNEGALAEDWQIEMISILTMRDREELLEAQP